MEFKLWQLKESPELGQGEIVGDKWGTEREWGIVGKGERVGDSGEEGERVGDSGEEGERVGDSGEERERVGGGGIVTSPLWGACVGTL